MPEIALVHLADLGLRQQRHVACGLADRARGHAQRRRQLGDALARAVPGQQRHRQPQLLAQEADHRRPGRAQRRQRAGGATELHREPRAADVFEPGRRAVEAPEPARCLEPERDRQRLLQQRAPGHQRLAMAFRQARGGARGALEVGDQQHQRTACHQHRRGIEDVLAGGAPVDFAAGQPGNLSGERAHQRRHRVAAGRCRATDRRDVEALGAAGARDLVGDRGAQTGRRAPRRAPAPPRRPASPAATRDRWSLRGPRRAPALHQITQASQTSKKTVSPWPCKWMSKRYPSSAGGGDQRRAPGAVGDAGQGRVARVRLRLVGEIDPRRDALQQPARVDRQQDVRRVHEVGDADRARLDRDDRERAVAIGRAAPEPAEPAGRSTACEVALGVALPALDEPVGHRLAFAVVEAPVEPDRPRRPLGHDVRAGGPGQREAEERPDGLRRRHP